MTRVLVTGANGFVGQTICATLSEVGRLPRAAVRSHQTMLTLNAKGEVAVVGNIGPNTSWGSVLQDVDAVVHLAGRVHVLKETFRDPLSEFHKTNVLGTERLARAAAEQGVRRLIFVSSIGVNGKVTYTHPFTEEQEPEPHNPYATSKWEAEKVLHRVAVETGLEVVVLRPPLVYGPGVKANFLRLMNLVDKSLPLPFGLVRNSRSLIYVGNLADAVVACMDDPKAMGETFLVSDDEDVSTPVLLRMIGDALHRPVRLLPVPPRLLRVTGRLGRVSSAVDPLLDSLTVDSSKIRRVLDWQAPCDMAEGLWRTAKWFREK